MIPPHKLRLARPWGQRGRRRPPEPPAATVARVLGCKQAEPGGCGSLWVELPARQGLGTEAAGARGQAAPGPRTPPGPPSHKPPCAPPPPLSALMLTGV